jgi:hypothetical protein
MRLEDFIDQVKRHPSGEFRLRAPLDDSELIQVRQRWPIGALPEDLIALLRHANGIDFWVNAGSPEGYFRLLPLGEIDSALRIMWGEMADDDAPEHVPHPDWLAISDNQDGAAFVVLDTDNHRYFLMDTCGADLTSPVGDNIEELLDYLYKAWIEQMGTS